jgi:predicted RNase H-like nuclease (RuvC/YqgF family)
MMGGGFVAAAETGNLSSCSNLQLESIKGDLLARIERQERTIEQLTKENEKLRNEMYDLREMTKCVIKDISVRLSVVEKEKRDSQTSIERAERMKGYLSTCTRMETFRDRKTQSVVKGRCATFESLRGYLDCDKWQLNRAIKALTKKYPGKFAVRKLNKTSWALVELPNFSSCIATAT